MQELDLRWNTAAACRGLDPEVFFPVGEKGQAMADVKNAKAICAPCVVREACLDFALSTDQRYGVWGGLTEVERRALGQRC